MKPNFRPLSRQVVLLTGATSGIGLATARRLSQAGARLILVARGEEECRALADELPDAIAAPADVADRAALAAAASAGIDRWGRIDTWINNAGVAIYGTVEQVPLAEQKRLFDTNYWGALNGMLEAVRLHRQGGAPAKIITLGSQLSDRAMIDQGPYSASKHALKGITDALRMEVEREGLELSITLIKPGSVDTPYMEHARNHLGAEGTRNPPRTYAPELVARGVSWACENHIRDLDVGGAGWLTAKAGVIAPALTDLGMALAGRFFQTSGKPPRRGMRDNLESSARAGETRSGQPGGRARETSLLMRAEMHPRAALALAAGSGLLTAILLRESRRRRERPHRLR
jgi:NADP-dependent 3-hydroxy acid dehydrogenase YdfG